MVTIHRNLFDPPFPDLAGRWRPSRASVVELQSIAAMLVSDRESSPHPAACRINYGVIEAMALGKKGVDMLARKGSGSASVLVHSVHSTSALSALH